MDMAPMDLLSFDRWVGWTAAASLMAVSGCAHQTSNEEATQKVTQVDKLESRIEELDQELAAKNRELAITSDYLNSTLDSMSDGVIAVDTHNVVTTFNRAAGDILGFEPDDIVGDRKSVV